MIVSYVEDDPESKLYHSRPPCFVQNYYVDVGDKAVAEGLYLGCFSGASRDICVVGFELVENKNFVVLLS